MSRVNYKAILAKYKAIGKGNVRLTQSTLILTKPIVATTTTYSFDVLDSQTATLQGNEIRLNQNDEFVVTHVGLYLQGIANTGATKLLSYAPFELDATKAGTVNALYDGTLKVSVNNVVYIDKWDTRKHECVPETQYAKYLAQSDVATTSYGTSPARIPKFASIKDGMHALEPMITLSGAKKNTIELTVPSAMTGQTFTNAANTATYSVVVDRIALVLRGLNAQNGASFQGTALKV